MAHIQEHLPAWRPITLAQLQIRKMSGLSNACYRVAVDQPHELADADTPKVVLYRKFECEIIDKAVEGAIFRSMAESRQGPGLVF